ncbi:McrB family protein [Fructilactobacillus carniphilus]|uniref:AAA+ ATPase domain-containing protein n=1 Tax=Fructilactobacillus carniphilus TaxID=2940297 RepID=A0ABY5BXT0_9LACO|nr:hypothetical protein [Fructilactobacillus carniphilus]USS91324.1 hypothetical protein M3M37_03785 [Fructilactobacillus carniphilus]
MAAYSDAGSNPADSIEAWQIKFCQAFYFNLGESNMEMRGEKSLNITTIGYLQSIDDVRIDRNDNSYIFLKLLSIPNSIYDEHEIEENEKIQVYTTAFKEEQIDNEFMETFARRKEIYNYLKNKIISSQLQKKYFQDGAKIRGQNAVILGEYDVETDDKYFDRIPVFSTENTNVNINNHKIFEANLIAGKSLGSLAELWSDSEKDIPLYIIWENKDDSYIYKIKENEDTQLQNNNLNTISVFPEDIERSHISEEWISKQYRRNDLLFMPSNNGIEDIKFINVFSNKYVNELNDLMVNEDYESISEINEDEITLTKKHTDDNIQQNSKELKFINRFKSITRKSKLFYSEKDLINFHTSMKSDGLVILAGLSGTGKSQLVTCYANALNPKEKSNSNLNFISVRPFWDDDSDLLGYLDTVNSIYRPGESGLLDTINEALKNPDKIFIVVFDEMNLAKVEHYFSQFLSILERNEGERKLTLYDKSIEPRIFNSNKYPSSMEIPNNIKFVGTINTDESTNDFSDKVLDRSNIITLDLIPFYKIKNIDTDESTDSDDSPITTTILNSMKENSELSLEDIDLHFLWSLHELLYKINKNLGIGWRVINQMNNYIANIPKNTELNKKNAIDLQISQRIMTKIKGSESQLKDLLDLDLNNEKSIYHLLEAYKSISSFEKTKKIINQKKKELEDYGFTI